MEEIRRTKIKEAMKETLNVYEKLDLNMTEIEIVSRSQNVAATEVTNVSDMLIQTQNLGKTTVAELSSAMGKVIPTANANSVALDQLCTGYIL